MALVVKKFGGTSVGSVERIRHVASLIDEHQRRTGDQVVAVVSAMSGETDRLIRLGQSCVAEPAPRELDVLMSTGEQVSIALLSMALIDRGVAAQSMLGLQARIATNSAFTNAQIEGIDAQAIQSVLAAGRIPVIAGFQGMDEAGNVTTLGRGGSDITAVAVAAALRADACYIYTDVEGVYSTDPRICPNARLLSQVCHEEMLEMASLGAKVLHPRSVYFAMQYQVPLVVLSTFTPGPGTWIVKEEALMEKPVVTGITHRTNEARLTVHEIPVGSTSLSLLFGGLAKEGLFIDVITQAVTGGGKTNVSFTVPDEQSSRALELAQGCVPELQAEGASLDRNIAKVSVVGVGMRYHTGVAARMFAALASENIDVHMIATSEIKISVVIPRKYCELAVRLLHDTFADFSPRVSRERE